MPPTWGILQCTMRMELPKQLHGHFWTSLLRFPRLLRQRLRRQKHNSLLSLPTRQKQHMLQNRRKAERARKTHPLVKREMQPRKSSSLKESWLAYKNQPVIGRTSF